MTYIFLVALLVFIFGAGVLLAIAGWRRAMPQPDATTSSHSKPLDVEFLIKRLALGTVAAVVILFLTKWWAAGLYAFGGGFVWLSILLSLIHI